jgi:hypothetical protein
MKVEPLCTASKHVRVTGPLVHPLLRPTFVTKVPKRGVLLPVSVIRAVVEPMAVLQGKLPKHSVNGRATAPIAPN